MSLRRALIPGAIIGLLFFCGCQSGEESGSGREAAATRRVPQRIISTAPSATEMLFALGLGDRVVGVTNFCDYPEEAKTKPKIGGFVNPDLETILSLEPDLVVTVPGTVDQTLLDRLRQIGVAVLPLEAGGIEGIFAAIEGIGAATGASEQARDLIASMRRQIENIRTLTEGAEKVRVLVLVDTPFYVAGEGTFVDDLIRYAGGMNLAADHHGYALYTVEEVIARRPQVIIEVSDPLMRAGGRAKHLEEVKHRWSRWQSIPAVREGRIYLIDTDYVTVPGPRIVEGLEQIVEFLHPGLLAEGDVSP